jgi:hypothetical protein
MLKPRIDGFVFERQRPEDALVHATQWLFANKPVERLHAER